MRELPARYADRSTPEYRRINLGFLVPGFVVLFTIALTVAHQFGLV